MKAYKLKSTGEQVWEIPSLLENAHQGDYRRVLKPFNRVSRRGHRGEVMLVHRDRLAKIDNDK